MEAFATVKDLKARWRDIDPSMEERAEALLFDATVLIMSELERVGIEIVANDEVQAANLVRVSCAMVMRAMGQGDGEQVHAWGGDIVANSCGDLYLSKADKRSLGIGRQRIGFVHPWGGSE